MSSKTYESLSDIFDITLKDNNYVNIANENAKTFGNYKHNYIVGILNSDEKKFDVQSDLKEMEKLLKKRKELLIEIPQQLITKLDKFNYSDISKDEKNLISYLQENNSEEIPLEIFDTINHIKQDFETALENYKIIYSGKALPNIDEEIKYTSSPKIKECEYEAKDYSIKKGLRTLGNVIINELVNYENEGILDEIGITKEELKDGKDNKEVINKLHTWVYRTAIKYKDYAELFKRIAEGKEYEDKSLGIKDYSDLELPEDEIFELKREVLKVPLENYERKVEDDLPRRVVNEKYDEYEEGKEKKSFWQKVKSLFK